MTDNSVLDVGVLAERESLASDIKADDLLRRIEECRLKGHKAPVQIGVNCSNREIEMMCRYCNTFYPRMMTEDEIEEYL